MEWRSSDSRPRIRRRRLKKSVNSCKTFKLITGLAGPLSKLLRLCCRDTTQFRKFSSSRAMVGS